jgi:hypothetical protein
LWAGVLLALAATYSAAYLVLAFGRAAVWPPPDAMAIWTWARFAVGHPAAEMYRPAILHVGQASLGLAAGEYYPFAYPPSFLLLLWPMGLLTANAAYWVGLASSLPLYLWATVGGEWRSPTTLAALAAPTTAIAVASGQTSFLAGALLIGGFRLVARRPVLAGVLFGLLTYKPQLGLLVPFALTAARAWRCIAAAAATFLALVALSSAAFGPHIWPAWLFALPEFSNEVASAGARVLHLMPTVRPTLLQIGAQPTLAWLVQGASAILAAGIVWAAFRAGTTRLAAATLLVATFLATPYAFVYDMPIVATAVLWLVIERDREARSFGLGELLVLTVAVVAPMTMPAQTHGRPLGLVSLILLLGMQVRAGRGGVTLNPRKGRDHA